MKPVKPTKSLSASNAIQPSANICKPAATSNSRFQKENLNAARKRVPNPWRVLVFCAKGGKAQPSTSHSQRSTKTGAPGPDFGTWDSTSPLQPQIRRHKAQKHHRNHAIHGEERSIQPPQIARRNQRVLIRQQQRHRTNANPPRQLKMKQPAEPHQQSQHRQVHQPRCPERSWNARSLRQTVKPRHAVVVIILARIEHIEAAVSTRMRASRDPRTAIHAAEGASPSESPSTRCDHRVIRFM